MGKVGVVLLHDVDELDAVGEIGQRRRAEEEANVGGGSLHEDLCGALVQAELDTGDSCLGLVALLAGGLEVRRDLLEAAGRVLEPEERVGEEGVDGRELALGGRQHGLDLTPLLAGVLELVLGVGEPARGGHREQGDDRGRDRGDANRHREAGGEGEVHPRHV